MRWEVLFEVERQCRFSCFGLLKPGLPSVSCLLSCYEIFGLCVFCPLCDVLLSAEQPA